MFQLTNPVKSQEKGDRHSVSVCSDLLNALYKAPDDVVMMSCINCHAQNVSSIVVANDNKKLTRAFLAWPGHELHRNRVGRGMAVGIHNHRYPLQLKLISGSVRNTVYKRSENGFCFNEWLFQSGETKRRPVLKEVGQARLSVATSSLLSKEGWLCLAARELHNIDCEGAAAWWVIEGELTQAETSLFTETAPVSVEGLYQPFNDRDAVISHVLDFEALFLK